MTGGSWYNKRPHAREVGVCPRCKGSLVINFEFMTGRYRCECFSWGCENRMDPTHGKDGPEAFKKMRERGNEKGEKDDAGDREDQAKPAKKSP